MAAATPTQTDHPTATELVLPVLVRQRAEVHPDRPFIHDADGTVLTYREATDRALTWASALRDRVRPGEVVATMVPSGTRSVALWHGLAWLRALEASLNEQYLGEFLATVVNDTSARILVIDQPYLDRFLEIAGDLEHVEEIIVLGEVPSAAHDVRPRVTGEAAVLDGHGPATDLPDPQPHDIAGVFYTSGTTGRSKGVLVPWTCLYVGGTVCLPPEHMGDDEVVYQIGSASHTGSKAILHLTALVGAQILLRPLFSASSFWPDVDRLGVTTAVVVGAMPHFLASSPERPDDADHSLRRVFMAPVVPDIDGFNRRFGVETRTVYGMTEIGVPLAVDGYRIEVTTSCGCVHQGFPWPEVRLVDEHDHEVPRGEIGELIVRTAVPWAMNAGYLNNPEQTAVAWRNGWFHTGDAMRQDEEGRFYFVDRFKDAIRRSGENISSFEVEAAVSSHPAVLESAAVPVPSAYTEDEILVFVVIEEGATLDPEELVAHVADRAPKFMVPRYVEVVDELPKTPNAKVKKAELRARGLGEATWDRLAVED